jgi:predicted nucleotidyltransferase
MVEPLQHEIARLCDEFSLVALYVFGSRAEEVAARVAGRPAPCDHPHSDVDVGALPRRGDTLSVLDKVRLTQRLESLLAASRVDLVVLPEAEAFLAADVVRGELLAATDLDAEAEAQLYYLRRAADLAPFLREQWSDVVGAEL